MYENAMTFSDTEFIRLQLYLIIYMYVLVEVELNKSTIVQVRYKHTYTPAPSQMCAFGGAGEVCGAGGTCKGRQARSRETEGGSKEKHGRNRST